MMRAGLDVVRLNASHGTAADRRRRLAQVREAAQRADRCVGVLLDLAGPKIRIECFREGCVQLDEGAPFTLDTALDPKAGTAQAVGVAYKNLPKDVGPGDTTGGNQYVSVLGGRIYARGITRAPVDGAGCRTFPSVARL